MLLFRSLAIKVNIRVKMYVIYMMRGTADIQLNLIRIRVDLSMLFVALFVIIFYIFRYTS